jgi:hypothetical protein
LRSVVLRSSVFSGSIAPWVALAIFLLLVVIGGFGVAGKFWAQVYLLLPVFVVFLYASDVCYAYLFHARFSAYFWRMLAVAVWSLVTGLVTLGSIIRPPRQVAGDVPPKLK